MVVDRQSITPGNIEAQTDTAAAVVRGFEPADLRRCQEIANSSYDFSHVLDLAASHIVVAEIGGEVVGFGYVHVWQWNKVAWLNDLVVDKDWRGQGIGAALVRHLADYARSEGCVILMDHPPANHPAIAFYLRLGFRFCGYNDSYFNNPKNRMAVFMGFDL
jgi:ribosomal protein S18 acetylase RimI-like enzyme